MTILEQLRATYECEKKNRKLADAAAMAMWVEFERLDVLAVEAAQREELAAEALVRRATEFRHS